VSAALAYERNDDYADFCVGIRDLVGIDLLQYKRGQMERRLRNLAERRGIPALPEYLAVLGRDTDELDRFLDRVTINVSQLWRNPEQWTMLGKAVLPELTERGRIRVWSAGCSYGAECYTAAAVARETTPRVRVEVLGTDIDRRMVERARTGHFTHEDARTVPPASLQRWFEKTETGYHARPDLQRGLTFEQGDLLTARFPTGAYDLVFCRNVVIYFTEEVRDRLHQRLATTLRTGGYLVVGSTERVINANGLGLTLTQPFTYRKA
jgi:chemotaxis protein methyltransferase CheR